MQSADCRVLENTVAWLTSGESVWLCTVLNTWGSSPRPKGSLFAFNSSGDKVGSLSGGCIEEDLVEKKLAAKDSSLVEKLIYGGDAELEERFKLPCGGRLEILVEVLSVHQLQHFEQLFQQVSLNKTVTRIIDMEESFREMSSEMVDGVELDEYSANLLKRETVLQQQRKIYHLLGARFTLFLIGATETSLAVATIAKMLDYNVIVCDPRVDAGFVGFDDTVSVSTEMPDDAIRGIPDLQHTAILALTHDPRVDDMGLMEALTTDAFYIGAMGSSRSSDKRRSRLAELGLTDQQIEKLYAPIGLSIGSKTPAEIAVSIMAQVTETRSKLLKKSVSSKTVRTVASN